MVTRTRLTLDEFLALPETEPGSEYFDGEVRQKVSPNLYHGILAARLAARFIAWVEHNEEAVVGVEVRHVATALNTAFLPDVHVTKMSRLAGHGTESPLTVIPDIAVEVLSPGDRPAAVLEKVDMYSALEIPALLLVDPQDRTIRIYRAGQSARTYTEDESIDLSHVLPGFVLDLKDLFAALPA